MAAQSLPSYTFGRVGKLSIFRVFHRGLGLMARRPMALFDSVTYAPRRQGNGAMLIFDRLRVPIEQFRHPDLSQECWIEKRAGAPGPVRLRGTFPIPGSRPATPIDSIRFGSDEVEFPCAGEYYFYCDLGAFKCLILDPFDSPFEQTKKIFAFVSKNIVHSQADIWLCMPDGGGRPFHWGPLMDKFFYTDQPLHLWCGESAHFLASILHARGIRCRIVHIHSEQNGHIVPEIWDESGQRWVLLDPDWGLCVADAKGRLLSMAEILSRLGLSQARTDHDGRDDLKIVNLVGKHWAEINMPSRFAGHITWTPERQSSTDPAEPGRYFEMIRECVVGYVRYETYEFDDALGTVHWKAWAE
jgi:hypothetical protein